METRGRTWAVALSLAVILLIPTGGTAAAGVIIIVNEEVSQSELDRETVKSIYLGKKSQWDNGDTIYKSILTVDRVHEEFLTRFVGKSPARYQTFLKHTVFTGTGVPPRSFSTEEDLLRFVSETPGAIGYIEVSTPHPGVKVISIK